LKFVPVVKSAVFVALLCAEKTSKPALARVSAPWLCMINCNCACAHGFLSVLMYSLKLLLFSFFAVSFVHF